MIDVDALQERLAARAAGEVLVWSAAHDRGEDAEAAGDKPAAAVRDV